jgi:hypothetical protein
MGRKVLLKLVAVANEVVDPSGISLGIEHLDQEEPRSMTREIQPTERLRLEPFHVEHEKIDICDAGLVEDGAEGPPRHRDFVVRFAPAARAFQSVRPVGVC